MRQAGYPREVLAVAPGFVRPDSAAAARIRVGDRPEQAGVAAVAGATHGSGGGRFGCPAPSRITSPFGAARVYNGEVQSRHLGTDFAGAVGAPVRAAGRGVVALVADFYLAGRAVYLDHGGGLVTAYFHLSRAYVAEGDTVGRGSGSVRWVGAAGSPDRTSTGWRDTGRSRWIR